jgi:hypothetical protein
MYTVFSTHLDTNVKSYIKFIIVDVYYNINVHSVVHNYAQVAILRLQFEIPHTCIHMHTHRSIHTKPIQIHNSHIILYQEYINRNVQHS